MSEEKIIVYSRDGDFYHEDKGLIDDAYEDWITGELEEGGYYSGERKEINVEDLVHNWYIDDIVDHMEECLYDIVGEVADNALSISKEKKEELTNIIKQFMKDNCSCSCWSVDNIEYNPFYDIK